MLFLNLMYLTFFLITFPLLLSQNRLAGLYYAALYIYSAFALFGYTFFPGLSEHILSYFGPDVGLSATLFCICNLVLFFFVNATYYNVKNSKTLKYWNADYNRNISLPGLFLLAFIFVVIAVTGAINWNSMGWNDEQFLNRPSLDQRCYIIAFKLLPGLCTISYALIRSRMDRGHLAFRVYSVLLFLELFVFSARMGDRGDLVALALGIFMYESLRGSLNLTLWFRMAAAGFVVILVLSVVGSLLLHLRDANYVAQGTVLHKIFNQDYYPPLHMLFAAIAYNYVHPWIVMKSNFLNSLVAMNYPYLQAFLMDLYFPIHATRSASMAFCPAAEGWMVMGPWGFLYSALVPTIGLAVWNAIPCLKQRELNVIIYAVLGTMAIDLVRGQSSYFIKILYMYVMPNLLVLFTLLRVRIRQATRAPVPRLVEMERGR